MAKNATERVVMASKHGLLSLIAPPPQSWQKRTESPRASSFIETILSDHERRAREVLREHGLPTAFLIETSTRSANGDILETRTQTIGSLVDERGIMDRGYAAAHILESCARLRANLTAGETMLAVLQMHDLGEWVQRANILVEEHAITRGRTALSASRQGGFERHQQGAALQHAITLACLNEAKRILNEKPDLADLDVARRICKDTAWSKMCKTANLTTEDATPPAPLLPDTVAKKIRGARRRGELPARASAGTPADRR